jgi:Skp family chaperone for outer membrane proteins
MDRFRRFIPALALLCLGAVVVLARPGSTASSKPSGGALPLGYVDIEEVAEKSIVGQKAKKDAEELRSKLQDELDRKQKLALLSPEQLADLKRLQSKPEKELTDAEKAKIADLQGATERLQKELQELQQKANPSEADSTRIQELTQRQRAAMTQLSGDVQKAEGELRENAQQIMRGLQDRIMKAVEEAAKAEGLAMVVHKEARLFGGVDITEAVINRLKK